MIDNSRMLTKMETGYPENELLLSCASVSREPGNEARIKAPHRQDLDWEYLLGMTREHRIMPLLYWHLGETSPEIAQADADIRRARCLALSIQRHGDGCYRLRKLRAPRVYRFGRSISQTGPPKGNKAAGLCWPLLDTVGRVLFYKARRGLFESGSYHGGLAIRTAAEILALYYMVRLDRLTGRYGQRVLGLAVT